MPRGYGGVAVIWKNEIDHLVRPIQDGSEKIQAVEIQGKAGDRLLLISVYMPAKGSKNHQIEYHDCVDQLYFQVCYLFVSSVARSIQNL
jgi:exonuclease III